MIDYKITRSRRKTIAIQVKDNGEVVVRAPLFVSKKRINEFIEAKSDWISKAQAKQMERYNKTECLSDDEIKILKTKAKTVLNEKVNYYSEIMSVRPNNVKITSAQKRFGSCNSKGNICFSYRLMLYPDPAIDYVVVHELAHLKELNHSKDFYAVIKSILPDYKEREKLLKQ